jgi:hypothetical protein
MPGPKAFRGVGGLLLVAAAGFPLATACAHPAAKAVPAGHIILLGIDGLGADMFQLGVTPNLKRLAREGALSLKARSVMPSVSSPAWSSHLDGAGPEQTGITSNGWQVDKFNFPPTDKDGDGYFPSIFTLIRRAYPEALTAVFYDWDALVRLFNKKDLSRVEFSPNFDETLAKAVPYILDKRPALTFIYVGLPDEVGHEFGWGSVEFYNALRDVDARVGGLLAALRKTDWWDSCTVIAVADHGGIGREHGGETPAEMTVPWIISGPGILKGRLIEQPVSILDTAPTIARILGIVPPESWTGRPVLGAFESEPSLASANTRVFVPKPKASLESGLYAEPRTVAFSVDEIGAEIRYIVSGGEAVPDSTSPLYEKPVPLSDSCVVTAAALKGGAASDTTVVVFERILSVKAVRLGKPPMDRPLPPGPLALVDGKWGKVDPNDRSWLAFAKDDFEAVADFGTLRELRKIGLDTYDDPVHGIYPPLEIEFAASDNGVEFRPLLRLAGRDVPGTGLGPAKLAAREIKPAKARFLRVRARNRGYCPAGSAQDGEKAKLLVDEIIFE